MPTLTNASDQSHAINYSTTWRETAPDEFASEYPHGLHLVPGSSAEISEALAVDLRETALEGLALTGLEDEG